VKRSERKIGKIELGCWTPVVAAPKDSAIGWKAGLIMVISERFHISAPNLHSQIPFVLCE
jgi:hypothetical protein